MMQVKFSELGRGWSKDKCDSREQLPLLDFSDGHSTNPVKSAFLVVSSLDECSNPD